MKYRYKRHVTNTLLYAVIITALIAIIKQYTGEARLFLPS